MKGIQSPTQKSLNAKHRRLALAAPLRERPGLAVLMGGGVWVSLWCVLSVSGWGRGFRSFDFEIVGALSLVSRRLGSSSNLGKSEGLSCYVSGQLHAEDGHPGWRKKTELC